MDLEAQVMMDKMDDTLSDADGKDLGGCCSDEDEEDDSITGSLNMPHAHPHGPAAMHHGPHHINGAPMPPGKNTYCMLSFFLTSCVGSSGPSTSDQLHCNYAQLHIETIAIVTLQYVVP